MDELGLRVPVAGAYRVEDGDEAVDAITRLYAGLMSPALLRTQWWGN